MSESNIKLDIKNKNNTKTITHNLRKFMLKNLLHRVPKYIETNHLTLVSLVWGSLMLLAGYKSINNKNYLLFIPLLSLFHIVTDNLDGAIGRLRNTGLIKWGFYMDHLLDFVINFTLFGSVIIYLNTVNPEVSKYFMGFYILSSIKMVETFLSIDDQGLDVTSCMDNICFGPIEGIILINLLIYYVYYTSGKVDLKIIKYIGIIFILKLVLDIYKKQKNIWKIDMKIKAETDKKK
jgi:hypothetical protein